MLRVVCCYVEGMLREETRQALGRYAGVVEYEKIPEDKPLAYSDAILRLWRECLAHGDDLCLIEQDIEIGPSTIYDFRACSWEYCGAPYPWTTTVGVAMGCTRFRHQFIDDYPNAVEEAVQAGPHFRQFDVVFQRRLLAKRYGQHPHVHAPVVHLNEAKRLRPDASPVPLEGVPVDDIGELL